jgi:hypothetical protein
MSYYPGTAFGLLAGIIFTAAGILTQFYPSYTYPT